MERTVGIVENPVPAIPILRHALERHRTRYVGDGYVFAGEKRATPVNPDNLSRRALKPALGRRPMLWAGIGNKEKQPIW